MTLNENAHYEPTFAKGNDGRLYRLQYRGFRVWTIDVQAVDRVWHRGDSRTFDDLMAWGTKRHHIGEGGLVRDLGIRLSGDLGRRHRRLGCDARVLGNGVTTEQLVIWGRKRETDVERIIHGELGRRGGATIWVEKSHHGRPTERIGLKHGFMTRDDILEHLTEVDRNMPGVNTVQLNALLKRVINHWAVLMVVSMKFDGKA
jgi:hypothetical protein